MDKIDNFIEELLTREDPQNYEEQQVKQQDGRTHTSTPTSTPTPSKMRNGLQQGFKHEQGHNNVSEFLKGTSRKAVGAGWGSDTSEEDNIEEKLNQVLEKEVQKIPEKLTSRNNVEQREQQEMQQLQSSSTIVGQDRQGENASLQVLVRMGLDTLKRQFPTIGEGCLSQLLVLNGGDSSIVEQIIMESLSVQNQILGQDGNWQSYGNQQEDGNQHQHSYHLNTSSQSVYNQHQRSNDSGGGSDQQQGYQVQRYLDDIQSEHGSYTGYSGHCGRNQNSRGRMRGRGRGRFSNPNRSQYNNNTGNQGKGNNFNRGPYSNDGDNYERGRGRGRGGHESNFNEMNGKTRGGVGLSRGGGSGGRNFNRNSSLQILEIAGFQNQKLNSGSKVEVQKRDIFPVEEWDSEDDDDSNGKQKTGESSQDNIQQQARKIKSGWESDDENDDTSKVEVQRNMPQKAQESRTFSTQQNQKASSKANQYNADKSWSSDSSTEEKQNQVAQDAAKQNNESTSKEQDQEQTTNVSFQGGQQTSRSAQIEVKQSTKMEKPPVVACNPGDWGAGIAEEPPLPEPSKALPRKSNTHGKSSKSSNKGRGKR